MFTWRLSIMFAVFFVALTGVVQAAELPKITPEIKRETTRYYLFDFEPKYRAADCLIELKVSADTGLDSDNTRYITELIWHYLYKFEPRAARVNMRFKNTADLTYKVFLQFPEECSRRYEIAANIGRYIEKICPEFTVKALNEHDQSSRRNLLSWGYWIDDPDYNVEFWKTRKKAHRGNHAALIRLAEKFENKHDMEDAFVMYRWAANCTDKTAQKAFALKNAARLSESFTAEQREILSKARTQNRKIMSSFGVRCLP